MGLLIIEVDGVNHGACVCGLVFGNPLSEQDRCSPSCTGLVKPKGKNRSNSATLQECVASALPYQSKTQWRNAAARLYHRAHRQDWMSYCTAHMKNRGCVANWSAEL
ncbi:hypothetical protein L4D76_00425 [Photobacterium sagamiensis]|uniref:hypothetical protein n=1 Tax=Photobacterium sagamiensis TaxID=2910241 RepID=UPI003D0F2816